MGNFQGYLLSIRGFSAGTERLIMILGIAPNAACGLVVHSELFRHHKCWA